MVVLRYARRLVQGYRIAHAILGIYLQARRVLQLIIAKTVMAGAPIFVHILDQAVARVLVTWVIQHLDLLVRP